MQNNPTVTFYFQDLHQIGNDISVTHTPGVAIAKAEAADLFQGAGALVDSNLDPTDDYYIFPTKTVNTAQLPNLETLVVAPGSSGTWRVTTVFRGMDVADPNLTPPERIVSAFDDSLIIQVLG